MTLSKQQIKTVALDENNKDYNDNFLKDVNDFFNSTTRGNTEIKYFNITKKELYETYPDLFIKKTRKVLPKTTENPEAVLKVMKEHYIPYLMTIKDKSTGLNKYKAYTVTKKYTTKDGTVKVYQNARVIPKKVGKFEILAQDSYVKGILENLKKGAVYKIEAIDMIWEHINANGLKDSRGNDFEYNQILNLIYRV